MGKRLIWNRYLEDNNPSIKVHAEDMGDMTNIQLVGWAFPAQQYMQRDELRLGINKLNKLVRIELWNALLNQDKYIDKMYIVDLNLSDNTLSMSNRACACMVLDIAIYPKDKEKKASNDELMDIINPLLDTITSNTYFNFKREKNG